ncbi:CAP domain-containing protein [Halosegnis marinus]|uniref:CAP domain-containing protein n=1 Tax=Halosegnis marinus TaxID=3034023 RepID=A0ABD5ZQY7_9EURY|nr:CAP domain-containing protein [Halosegnis sp. DT85]
MVNKVVLVFVAVIALTAMAVGAFVGMELGGPGTATPAGATATPTATATAGGGGTGGGTATATAGGGGTGGGTATATATATATPRPDIDREELRSAVVAEINERRGNRSVQRLSTDPTLMEMAQFHSDNMAAQGYLSNTADGFTTAERYEEFDLADRCRIADDSNTGTREDEELEVLGRVTVGEDGSTVEELATTAVDTWFSQTEPRRRLTYRNADQIGVGANVTDAGRAYLTVDLC